MLSDFHTIMCLTSKFLFNDLQKHPLNKVLSAFPTKSYKRCRPKLCEKFPFKLLPFAELHIEHHTRKCKTISSYTTDRRVLKLVLVFLLALWDGWKWRKGRTRKYHIDVFEAKLPVTVVVEKGLETQLYAPLCYGPDLNSRTSL